MLFHLGQRVKASSVKCTDMGNKKHTASFRNQSSANTNEREDFLCAISPIFKFKFLGLSTFCYLQVQTQRFSTCGSQASSKGFTKDTEETSPMSVGLQSLE